MKQILALTLVTTTLLISTTNQDCCPTCTQEFATDASNPVTIFPKEKTDPYPDEVEYLCGHLIYKPLPNGYCCNLQELHSFWYKTKEPALNKFYSDLSTKLKQIDYTQLRGFATTLVQTGLTEPLTFANVAAGTLDVERRKRLEKAISRKYGYKGDLFRILHWIIHINEEAAFSDGIPANFDYNFRRCTTMQKALRKNGLCYRCSSGADIWFRDDFYHVRSSTCRPLIEACIEHNLFVARITQALLAYRQLVEAFDAKDSSTSGFSGSVTAWALRVEQLDPLAECAANINACLLDDNKLKKACTLFSMAEINPDIEGEIKILDDYLMAQGVRDRLVHYTPMAATNAGPFSENNMDLAIPKRMSDFMGGWKFLKIELDLAAPDIYLEYPADNPIPFKEVYETFGGVLRVWAVGWLLLSFDWLCW